MVEHQADQTAQGTPVQDGPSLSDNDMLAVQRVNTWPLSPAGPHPARNCTDFHRDERLIRAVVPLSVLTDVRVREAWNRVMAKIWPVDRHYNPNFFDHHLQRQSVASVLPHDHTWSLQAQPTLNDAVSTSQYGTAAAPTPASFDDFPTDNRESLNYVGTVFATNSSDSMSATASQSTGSSSSRYRLVSASRCRCGGPITSEPSLIDWADHRMDNIFKGSAKIISYPPDTIYMPSGSSTTEAVLVGDHIACVHTRRYPSLLALDNTGEEWSQLPKIFVSGDAGLERSPNRKRERSHSHHPSEASLNPDQDAVHPPVKRPRISGQEQD